MTVGGIIETGDDEDDGSGIKISGLSREDTALLAALLTALALFLFLLMLLMCCLFPCGVCGRWCACCCAGAGDKKKAKKKR